MSAEIFESLSTNQKGDFADGVSYDNDIQLKVFDSLDRLEEMQSQWDEFVESLGYEIFNTYDWCRIWWKYYGGGSTLRIFIFYYKEKIVGLLPTYIEKVRIGPVAMKIARIVGTTATLAEISPPISQNYISQVLGQWLEHLYSEFKPDLICVGPLSGTYDRMEQLASGCAAWGNHRYVAEKRETAVQTIFRLGADLDEYLASLSGKERHEVNRHCRNILKVVHDNDARLICDFVSASDLPGNFDDFVRMHNVHWQQLGQSGHFNDWPNSKEFHREMAEIQMKRGRLRLLKVCAGSFCAGYEYAYKFSRTYTHFLNSRASSPELERVSVGKVGFCELVRKAITEGVNLINSLRGRYEYKLRMGGVLVPIYTILIFRKGLFANLRVCMFRCLSHLVHLCYYRVWFCRVIPQLRLRRRPLWNLWIRTNSFAY